MNNFDELLLEVKDELMNEKCVQEYFFLKEKVEKNSELKKLDSEMKKHQKLMCQNKDNEEIYKKEKSQYEELKNKFENNPLMVNFQNVKDEVYTLLVDIKNILS